MGGEGGSRCFHIASKPFVMAGVDSGLVDIIIIILIIINHHHRRQRHRQRHRHRHGYHRHRHYQWAHNHQWTCDLPPQHHHVYHRYLQFTLWEVPPCQNM